MSRRLVRERNATQPPFFWMKGEGLVARQGPRNADSGGVMRKVLQQTPPFRVLQRPFLRRPDAQFHFARDTRHVPSPSDLEWWKEMYDRFNHGDRQAVLEGLAPDFVVQDGTLPEFTEEIRGLNAYEAYLDHLAASFSDLRYEVASIHEVEDRFVAKVHASLRPAGTHMTLTGTMGHVWTLKDGKATRLRIYPTWEATLEATGLA